MNMGIDLGGSQILVILEPYPGVGGEGLKNSFRISFQKYIFFRIGFHLYLEQTKEDLKWKFGKI